MRETIREEEKTVRLLVCGLIEFCFACALFGSSALFRSAGRPEMHVINISCSIATVIGGGGIICACALFLHAINGSCQ